MEINYEYYRIFYYVAKYKNITQAAGALLSSQPNVTRAIKNLEAALGCPLFVRSKRGVALTPEGGKLYAHIAVACEQIAQGERELLTERELEGGSVAVGTTEIALYGILIPTLERFRQTYPRVRVRILTGTTEDTMAALRRGSVDFCLVTTPVEEGTPFQKTVLKDFQELLCAGGAYRELADSPQSLSILKQYPVVSPGKNTKTYDLYCQLALANGLEWAPDMEVSTADQLLPMIRRGLGIGFVAEFFLEEALRGGEIREIPLNIPRPRRSICLITDPSRRLGIAAGKLLESLHTP